MFHQGHHAIADATSRNVGTNRQHNTRSFLAGYEWRLRKNLVFATDDEQVRIVDPGGGHVDHHLAGTDDGIGQLSHHQRFDRPESASDHRLHGRSIRLHAIALRYFLFRRHGEPLRRLPWLQRSHFASHQRMPMLPSGWRQQGMQQKIETLFDISVERDDVPKIPLFERPAMSEQDEAKCKEVGVDRTEISRLHAFFHRSGDQFVRFEFESLDYFPSLPTQRPAFLIADDRGAHVAPHRFAIGPHGRTESLQRVGHSFELLWYFFLIFFEDCHEHEKQQFFFILDVGIDQTGAYPRRVRDFLNCRAMIAVDRKSLDGSAHELFAPPFDSVGVFTRGGQRWYPSVILGMTCEQRTLGCATGGL